MVTGHSKGGYNLDTNEIGVVLICVGIIQVVWQASWVIWSTGLCVITWLFLPSLSLSPLSLPSPSHSLPLPPSPSLLFLPLPPSRPAQLVIYPTVIKWTGYRRALQVSILVFIISCVCIPFSNKITGPISGTDTVSTSQNTSLFSGSGSGGGWNLSLIQNVTQELNTTLNSTDYCNTVQEDVIGVNENSIKRVPITVWLVLITFVLLMVVSR